MDTNQVSSTRTMLNISTPSSQGIKFSQGEVVKGTVQEVRPDGMVMITIKGKTIEAMTEVQVQPGQQLYLKVDDFREGKTFLKVISPQAMEVIENANLSANLLDMGVAVKEENIAMARKLLEYNMPVTANNLNEMAKGVKLLGSATPRSLEIVAFVMSRNLPVDATTLKALEQYTLPESNIAKLVQSVVQSLRELGKSQIANLAALLENDLPVNASAPAPNNRAESSTGSTTGGTNNNAVMGNTASAANGASEGGSQSASAATASSRGGSSSPPASLESASQALPSNPPAGPAGATIAAEEGPETVITRNNTANIDQKTMVGLVVTEEGDSPAPTGTRAPAGMAANAPDRQLAAAAETPPGSQTLNLGDQSPTRQAAPSGTQPSGTTINPPAANTDLPEPSISNAPALLAGDDGVDGEAQAVKNLLGAATIQDEGSANTRPVPAAGETGNSRNLQASTSQSAQVVVNDNEQQPASPPTEAAVKPVPGASEEPPAAKNVTTASNPQAKDTDIGINTAAKAAASSATGNNETNKNLAAAVSDLLTGAANREAEAARTSAAPMGTSVSANKVSEQLNLLRTLIEWMQVDGREPASEISGKLERAIATDKDVIRGLTLLQDAIKGENTQARSPAVHDLLSRIDNLEKELSGQKMFNYLSRTATDNQFNFYYFSIPVKVGGETHQCQLRFNKDGRRDLRNVDNLSFVVSLDTGKMGLVLFHVNWQRSRTLTLQGVAESDSVAEHLNKNIQALVNKLKDLGYGVQNLGIKVSQEQLDESLKIRVEEAPLSIRPLGIDVIV